MGVPTEADVAGPGDRALGPARPRDLTVVSYGGPDVGLLLAAGKVKHLVYGFVSLDTVPLEPHFQAARQNGTVTVSEWDEGMLQWGLYAAASRLSFLPLRSGLGSDVLTVNPDLKMVTSPYEDRNEYVAVPALHLDAALVHLNRADASGNAQYLGPDAYFDDLFCGAAERAYVSCERIVSTAELTAAGPVQSLLIRRSDVRGVVEAPNGAHFTTCEPDYGRDEAFQREYAQAAADPDAWAAFTTRYLSGDEAAYQAAVAAAALEAVR
jgi:glutaconate CoA-transferase subunit A